MMAFIAGLVIGSMFGAVTVALCAVGGDSPSAGRVIVSDEETDCATGFCTCGNCGEPIDPWDAWCRHCGARMEDE